MERSRSASFFTRYSPVICFTNSSESETTSTSASASSTAFSRPAMSARYSATLFVATPIRSPCAASTVPSSASSTNPYAAGPGLPRAPPSVKSRVVTRADRRRRRPRRTDARRAARRGPRPTDPPERRSRHAAPRRAPRVRAAPRLARCPRRRGTCPSPPCRRSGGCTRRSRRRRLRRPPRASCRAPRAGRTTRACSRSIVDLRALELARIVDIDRLPLGEHVERRLPRLAMPVAGVLRPAEREMHLGADRAGVHVRDPSLEVAHRAERAVHVAREDRGREPEFDPVRHGDRLVEIAHPDERRRRAEDLLLRDAHTRLHVGEDRRPVEVAATEVAFGRDLAAREQTCALVAADLRVRVDLLQRSLVDDGADLGLVLTPPYEAQLLDALDETLLQGVVHLLVRDHARRSGAALARRPECRPHDAVDGEVEIRVVHDDDRVLAAELEVHVLERVRAGGEHLHAGLARACQRDDANVGMAHHPVSDVAAATVDDVHDALRDSGL